MSPTKKRIKDPHASLDLFTEKDSEENVRVAQPALIAPRASAKPADRNYNELFAAGNEDYEPDTKSPSSARKPYTQPITAPKGAGGLNYQPCRLFDQDAPQDLPAIYKSNPAKYNHFDIGETMDEDHFQHAKPQTTKNVPLKAKSNKHLSQWDFEDFVTPEKTRHRVRAQDVRHFGWSDDEGEKVETPGKQPKVVQPRPDTKPHFEFNDDLSSQTPPNQTAGRQKGNAHSTGLGLYQNNLYEDETNDTKSGHEKEPLSAVTTNVRRTKDFDKHWIMSDVATATGDENRPLAGDRTKAVQKTDANWDASWGSYDQSPEQNKKGAGAKPLRKGMESHWDFGDDVNAHTVSGKKAAEKNY